MLATLKTAEEKYLFTPTTSENIHKLEQDWRIWTNIGTGASTTTSNYPFQSTWDNWTSSTTSATNDYSAQATWRAWTTSASGQTGEVHIGREIDYRRIPPVFPVESEEEKQARVQRELRAAEERKARIKQKELASIEAKSLLDSVLTDIQRECFQKEDWFLVVGKSGNIYRIRKGYQGNIDLISPDGKVIRSFCIHIPSDFPMEDNLVAQKLHLEANDTELVERANVFRNYGENGDVIDIEPYIRRAA